MKKCKEHIDNYIQYLLGNDIEKRQIEESKQHISKCPHCQANLKLFSNIIENYIPESKFSSNLSCNEVAKYFNENPLFNFNDEKNEKIVNHLLVCKDCREKFIDKFVATVENEPALLDKIKDIPKLHSPLLLLELKKEKEYEIKKLIKYAEASIVRIKPDGGIRYNIHSFIEDSIETLPPCPDNVKIILDLIDNDADLKDISKEISKDVSLSARILQIANSPYYRGKLPVEDIQRALSRIGLKSISRIITVFSLYSTIINQAGNYLSGYDVPMKIFMNYSTMVAIISMLLAPKYNTKVINMNDFAFEIDMIAYTAGLVENLGMIVLNRCFEGDIKNEMQNLIKNGFKITDAEQTLLGITHPEVSGKILKKWKLSEPFINSVVFHHKENLNLSEDNPLLKIMYVADTIASEFLRPNSKMRPYLHIVDSEETLFRMIPFNSRNELEQFYTNELIPAFDSHEVMYDTNLYIK